MKSCNEYPRHLKKVMKICQNYFENTSLFLLPQFGHVDVLKEPVDRWRDLNGNNLLQLMYEDPQRFV